MYNKEIKRSYFMNRSEVSDSTKRSLKGIFKRSEVFEDLYDKDVAEFNKKQIVALYKTFNYETLSNLVNTNGRLSSYSTWYIENGYSKDNINSFSCISQDVLGKCLDKEILDSKIITKETLLEWCDRLPGARDKFLLLALFEGISGDDYREIINLKWSDVHEGYVDLGNRTVSISNELYNIINDCKSENKYITYNSRGEPYRTMPLFDKGYVYKSTSNERKNGSSDIESLGRRIYMRLRIIFKILSANCEANHKINSKNIIMSGFIYSINREAINKGIPATKYIYTEDFDEIAYMYNKKIKKSMFVRNYNNYLTK